METKHHHDALNEQQKISKQQLEYEITSIRYISGIPENT